VFEREDRRWSNCLNRASAPYPGRRPATPPSFHTSCCVNLFALVVFCVSLNLAACDAFLCLPVVRHLRVSELKGLGLFQFALRFQRVACPSHLTPPRRPCSVREQGAWSQTVLVPSLLLPCWAAPLPLVRVIRMATGAFKCKWEEGTARPREAAQRGAEDAPTTSDSMCIAFRIQRGVCSLMEWTDARWWGHSQIPLVPLLLRSKQRRPIPLRPQQTWRKLVQGGSRGGSSNLPGGSHLAGGNYTLTPQMQLPLHNGLAHCSGIQVLAGSPEVVVGDSHGGFGLMLMALSPCFRSPLQHLPLLFFPRASPHRPCARPCSLLLFRLSLVRQRQHATAEPS
jgi:hypothetical protein